MLIKKMLNVNSKDELLEKIDTWNKNEKINLIFPISEIFECKDNDLLKEILKRYKKDGKEDSIRSFIEQQITIYQQDRFLQFREPNDKKAKKHKEDADKNLRNMIRLTRFSLREGMTMYIPISAIVSVQDYLYQQYTANAVKHIDIEEYMPKNIYNELFEMCDEAKSSEIIYLYPFFKDKDCIDRYVAHTPKINGYLQEIKWQLNVLHDAKTAIEKGTYLMEEEKSLSGEDLKYFYNKMKENIFLNASSKDLVNIYANPDYRFIINEGNIKHKFESLMDRNYYDVIYKIIYQNDNAFNEHLNIFSNLDNYQLRTIMNTAVEDKNTYISTVLYTSRVTNIEESEYFELLKESHDFKNICKMCNYLIKYYHHDNKNKSKYLAILKDFIDYIVDNVETLKEIISENCTKDNYSEYVDMIDFLFYSLPMDLDKGKFRELIDEIKIDFRNMPDEDY